MKPYYNEDEITIYNGDCIEVLRQFPDNTIDTIITDPPYGLEFMGKEWDKFGVSKTRAKRLRGEENWKHYDRYFNYGEQSNKRGRYSEMTVKEKSAFQEFIYQWATECLRVAKPGATLLCFGGTRTWHRLACAIEDSGWQIKDTLMWLYGSGFPKATDISKQIDKRAGAERKIIGKGKPHISGEGKDNSWESGYKLDYDLTESVSPEAKLWNGWKSHGLKPAFEPIIMAMKPNEGSYAENALKWGVAGLNIDGARIGTEQINVHDAPKGTFAGGEQNRGSIKNYREHQGRFPANLILDEEVAEQVGEPSRFFYVAKASRTERGENNTHPTVKPLKLMEYLITLTEMPNKDQIYLDPFMGSGTTLVAAKKLGRKAIGIELSKEYCDIANKRLNFDMLDFGGEK